MSWAEYKKSKRLMKPDTWAKRVVDGKIPAGQYVKEACRRHLRDRDAGVHLWVPEALDHFEEFAYELGSVSEIETSAYVPFTLMPWQRFVCGSIFGWRVGKNDQFDRPQYARRFQIATVFTPKGNGKSPLGSMINLYQLCADVRRLPDGITNEYGETWTVDLEPHIFITGSTADQAINVAMRPIQRMVELSPSLSQMVSIKGGTKPVRAVCEQTQGYIQAMGRRVHGEGKAGLIVQGIHAEELHEWQSDEQYRILEHGTKRRPQPLTMLLSNSGTMRSSIARRERDAAIMAARATSRQDDIHFGFVAENDEVDLDGRSGKDEWYPKQKHWAKGNLSLGVTIKKHALHKQINRAKTASQRAEVLRLSFGYWPGDTSFCDWDTWEENEVESLEFPPPGTEMFVGMDLGWSRDMTAIGMMWQCPETGKWCFKVRYFVPRDRLQEIDERSVGHLLDWHEDGYIDCPPGETMDYATLARVLYELGEQYPVIGCDDGYRIDQFLEAAARVAVEDRWGVDVTKDDQCWGWKGVELWKHPQGYRKAPKTGLFMDSSIDATHRLLADRALAIEQNPVLAWNMESARIEVNATGDYRKLAKPKEGDKDIIGKTDGLVAFVMCCGLLEAHQNGNLRQKRLVTDVLQGYDTSWLED